jgi:hypothetical protein
MPCYSPLAGYKDPVSGGWTHVDKVKGKNYEPLEVACGSCIGCRLDRSRMWSARIVHEASLYEYGHGNSFVTLTYDDDHIPPNWSLKKEDFQNFMKRLRNNFDQRIRFYHCGEYGSHCKHKHPISKQNLHVDECPGCNVGRPHYHAILFNVRFDDLEIVGRNNEHIHYTSKTLSDIWKMGNVQVGDVTADSAGYVARYCLKKVNGRNQDDHYRNIDPVTGEITYVQPEYSTMSNRPGIAKEWFDQYWRDCYPSGEIPIPGKGVIRGAVRYFDKMMEQTDEELLEEVKETRRVFRDENADEYTPERLKDKYRVKQAQIRTLKREL